MEVGWLALPTIVCMFADNRLQKGSQQIPQIKNAETNIYTGNPKTPNM